MTAGRFGRRTAYSKYWGLAALLAISGLTAHATGALPLPAAQPAALLMGCSRPLPLVHAIPPQVRPGLTLARGDDVQRFEPGTQLIARRGDPWQKLVGVDEGRGLLVVETRDGFTAAIPLVDIRLLRVRRRTVGAKLGVIGGVAAATAVAGGATAYAVGRRRGTCILVSMGAGAGSAAAGGGVAALSVRDRTFEIAPDAWRVRLEGAR